MLLVSSAGGVAGEALPMMVPACDILVMPSLGEAEKAGDVGDGPPAPWGEVKPFTPSGGALGGIGLVRGAVG